MFTGPITALRIKKPCHFPAVQHVLAVNGQILKALAYTTARIALPRDSKGPPDPADSSKNSLRHKAVCVSARIFSDPYRSVGDNKSEVQSDIHMV